MNPQEYTKNRLETGLHLIPPHMHEGIKRYVLEGIPPGDFLTALLANDFLEACARADSENQQSLHAWAVFIYNHLPAACHGTYREVSDWQESFAIQPEKDEFDD